MDDTSQATDMIVCLTIRKKKKSLVEPGVESADTLTSDSVSSRMTRSQPASGLALFLLLLGGCRGHGAEHDVQAQQATRASVVMPSQINNNINNHVCGVEPRARCAVAKRANNSTRSTKPRAESCLVCTPRHLLARHCSSTHSPLWLPRGSTASRVHNFELQLFFCL
jgi:hypothetical protein